jgi:putative Mg2+ transporter-C (MgtC) family protein
MPTHLTWTDGALRLLCAIIAGFALGYDRGTREHSAGLRTTLLVCLAATVAMIQVNILLGATENQEGHTLTLDLMRLPLGILSGVGFIGAGTILRRGNKVEGVTTAATLWFVTVIGLCLGGGQYGLGLASTLAALAIVTLLKTIESRILPWRRGKIVATLSREDEEVNTVERLIRARGLLILSRRLDRNIAAGTSTVAYEVRYSLSEADAPSQILSTLTRMPGMVRVGWEDEIR